MTTPKLHMLNKLMIFALFILLSCGGDDAGDDSSGGCPWNGNCSSLAPAWEIPLSSVSMVTGKM